MLLCLCSCCLFDLNFPFSSHSHGVFTRLSGFGLNILSYQNLMAPPRKADYCIQNTVFTYQLLCFIPHVLCTLFEGRGIMIPLLTPWIISITAWMLGICGTSCLSFFLFFFFFLTLVYIQKAYYTNVNRIAFITFFQYLKQTGLESKAWIRNLMRDFLFPNYWIGKKFWV